MKHALLVGLGLLALIGSAKAEHRTFVIANQPGEYGVDQCLSTGARCGAVVADAYCQSRDFAKAKSFRLAEATEVTSAVTAVSAGTTPQLIAIECER
jgi:hypothetical protein